MADKQRTRSPNLTDVLRSALENRLLDLHTTLPGKIHTWDPATQTADIKPLLQRPLLDEEGKDLPTEVLPIIPNVTVRFPRADYQGGKFFISMPLKKDDLVTLHFCERSLDLWLSKAAGEDVDPVDFRMHDLSDCFAVPGLYPFTEVLSEVHPDNLVIGKDDGGMQLHFKPDDTVQFQVGGTADVSVCIAEALKTFWDSTFKPYIDAHLHPTGVGPSGVPTVPAPSMPTAIISDNVKLKDN